MVVMTMCTMHDDENVNKEVAGLVGYCLNEGVEFMERMSNGRLFQTVGPMKEKDLSLKVLLFVLAHEV